MKVTKVQIPNLIKNIALTTPLLFATTSAIANKSNLQQDLFVKSEQLETEEPNSISPATRLAGSKVYPAVVIDLSDQTAYHYDLDAVLIDSYPIRFVENKINTGLNLVNIEKHKYNSDNVVEKIVLTEVNQNNGRVKNTHQQVLVGAQNENIQDDMGLFTNVILINNDSAKKITDILTEDQYILIRR